MFSRKSGGMTSHVCVLPAARLLLIFLSLCILTSAAPKLNVTFQSDAPLSQEEFFYLTDLKPHSEVTPEKIAHAKKQLKMKKRFSTITVSATGSHVHFDLVANWIFKDVIIKGIWFGKDKYKNLYLQHPGDNFDISLHEESIDAIKKSLENHGYLNSSVVDEIIYNKKNKTISVSITIKKRAKSKSRIVPGVAEKKLFDLDDAGDKPMIEFANSRFFSTKQLHREFVDNEKPSWLLDPNIIAEQVLHRYHAHGFWSAKVSVMITPTECKKSPDRRKCVIYIDEGRRTKIRDVIVKDRQSGKEEKNKFFFKFLLSKKYYDEDLLNECIDRLKEFYIEHGFWNFSVVSTSIEREKIVLTIDKGRQKFLEKISMESAPQSTLFIFKNQAIPAVIGLPLNPTSITEQRTLLLDHFQKQGYWYVDAQPEYTTSLITKNDRYSAENVHVRWNVSTGERVTFDKLILRGSTRLPFKKIMKEIQFKQGDVWDKKKLDYSRKKLKELDIFKYITMHPKKISSQQSKKPIVLTVLDDEPIELKVRGGYFLTSKNFLLKRESTYKIGTTLLVRNPCNIADKLSLNMDISRFEKNFDLDYHIPHIFGKTATAGKCKIYAHDYVHPLQVGKNDSAYEATQNGFLFCITKEYRPLSFWGINVGNEWMRTRQTRGNINFSPEMLDRTIPYFFIEPNIVIDRSDDKIRTTKGTFTFGSIKIMFPEDRSEPNPSITCKVMIDHSIFAPVYHDIVCALRIRWGHLFREDFSSVMPIERFYLGGPNSVRGYAKDSVPPLGKMWNNSCKKNEYAIQGGSSMINGNAEIRFPMYKSLGGVLFQDIGVLSQSGFSGFKGRWYPTSGFGLRYNTPIGALRFDIGWKWKRSFETEPTYAWYLTLGQAF